MGMERLMSLATVNPMLLIVLVLGGLLLVAVVFSIAALITLIVLVVLGWLLPIVILIIGLYFMFKGRVVLGGIIVLVSVIVWGIAQFGGL